MEKKCDVCGNAFETRTRAAVRERFCSKGCYKKFWNAKLSAARHAVNDLNRVCVVCSSAFVADPTHPRALTCSKKCSQAHQNKLRSDRRAAVRDLAPRNCALCGAEFIPNKFAPDKKFCSSRCAGLVAGRAYYARTRTEKNTKRARRYRAGRNWHEAMERAEFRCELCSSKEQLHVHHKDGTGEDDKANHQVENLVVLCHSCHSSVHRIKYRIIDGQFYVFGLVFDWLKPKTVKILSDTR